MKSNTAVKSLTLGLGVLALCVAGPSMAHGGHGGGGHHGGYHGGGHHGGFHGRHGNVRVGVHTTAYVHGGYHGGYRGGYYHRGGWGYRGYGYGYHRGYYRNGVWIAPVGVITTGSCLRYVCKWRTNVNGVSYKWCGNVRVC